MGRGSSKGGFRFKKAAGGGITVLGEVGGEISGSRMVHGAKGLNKYENQIGNKPVEYGGIVPMVSKRGGERYTSDNPHAVMRPRKAKLNEIVTHNHPGGGGLSGADINNSIRSIGGIRAVSKQGKKALRVAEYRVVNKRKNRQALKKNPVSPDKIDVMQNKIINKELRKSGGKISYQNVYKALKIANTKIAAKYGGTYSETYSTTPRKGKKATANFMNKIAKKRG